jgi:mannose/cellobiose epimerase-like protein (N-acyl-D-glucosamine 2-epimerase family)
MEPTLWVGHNLKTAWVLLRLHQLTGNARYAELAQRIAEVQSEKGWDDRYGGWRFWFQDERLSSAYDKERWWTPAVEIRDWWTQTEGNFLMLNLYRLTGRPEYLETFQRTAVLWDRHLVDHEHGDVFEQVQPNGEPAKTQKGHLYKSAYHVMEHALFNYLYLSFWVEKRDVELHFLLSAEHEGERHAVKLVEDPDVILKRVEIDGKEWKQCNHLGNHGWRA